MIDGVTAWELSTVAGIKEAFHLIFFLLKKI